MSIESAPITAEERWSPDELALLEALPPSLGGRIRTLLRDRDHYLALHASLIDVERATSLEERLRIFVQAIHSIGYGRVGIAIREGDHEGPRCIAVGMDPHDVLALSDLRHGGAELGVGGTHVLPLTTPAGHLIATLVRILHDKGFLEQLNDERPFVYRAARSYEEVSRRLLGDVLDRVFQGSREQLLVRLVEQRKLSARERAVLEEILKEADA